MCRHTFSIGMGPEGRQGWHCQRPPRTDTSPHPAPVDPHGDSLGRSDNPGTRIPNGLYSTCRVCQEKQTSVKTNAGSRHGHGAPE